MQRGNPESAARESKIATSELKIASRIAAFLQSSNLESQRRNPKSQRRNLKSQRRNPESHLAATRVDS